MLSAEPDEGSSAMSPADSPPQKPAKVPRELLALGIAVEAADERDGGPKERRGRRPVSYAEIPVEVDDDFGSVSRGRAGSGSRTRRAPERLSPSADSHAGSARISQRRQAQLEREREEREHSERARRANSQYSLRKRGHEPEHEPEPDTDGPEVKHEDGAEEDDEVQMHDSDKGDPDGEEEEEEEERPSRKLKRNKATEDSEGSEFDAGEAKDDESEEEQEHGDDDEDDDAPEPPRTAPRATRAPQPLMDASDDLIGYGNTIKRPRRPYSYFIPSDDEDELVQGTPALRRSTFRAGSDGGDQEHAESSADEEGGAGAKQSRRHQRSRRAQGRKRAPSEPPDNEPPAKRPSRAERYAKRNAAGAGETQDEEEEGEKTYQFRERKRINYKQKTFADLEREWKQSERRALGRDRDQREDRRAAKDRGRSAANYLKKGIASFFERPRGRGRDQDSSSDDERTFAKKAGGSGGSSSMQAPLPMNLRELAKDPSRKALAVQHGKNLADTDPLPSLPGTTFDHLGGLDDHIRGLKEMVLLPLLYPEVYENLGVQPPRGVLFHGPPGTGKTMLARALANSCSTSASPIAFFMRKGSDILSKWVGEAERQLRLLFEEAKAWQPSIIFFDEIDGLAPVRSAKQDQVHSSIVSTLLALMDGLDSRGQVVVIGATNRIDAIDPALRRPGRFDREFLFPLPSLQARRKIIGSATTSWNPAPEPEQLDRLAEVTQGYAGADVRALCTEAALQAVRGRWPQIYESADKLLIDASDVEVTMEDFLTSMKKIVPSTYRHTAAAARPLPAAIEPLLVSAVDQAVSILDKIAPIGTEERRTEWIGRSFPPRKGRDIGWPDDQHGRPPLSAIVGSARFPFSSSSYTLPGLTYRQALKPRLLLYGKKGMALSAYLGPAICERLEGWRYYVRSVDLASLIGDAGRTPESAIAQLFHELRRQKPAVAYIPNVDAWWLSLPPIARATFIDLLDAGTDPHDPIVILATSETELDEMPKDLMANVFGWYGKGSRGIVKVDTPSPSARTTYFAEVLDEVSRPPPPRAFPIRALDGSVLGLVPSISTVAKPAPPLPLAPPAPPKEITDDDRAAIAKHDLFILGELRRELRTMTQEISRNRSFKDFSRPLDPIEDVVDAIKTPMNLLIVFEKINAGEYWTADEWLEDLQLIVDNWTIFAAERGVPRKEALDMATRACDMVDLARNMVYNMNAELLTECARTAARLEAEKGAPKEKERQRRKQDREEQEKKWEAQRRNRGLEQAEQARLEVPEDRDPGTDDLLVEMVVQRRDMGEHEDGEPERPEGEAEAEQPADIEKDGQEGDALVADGPRAMNTEDVESNRQLSEPEAMEIEGEPAATQFFNADEVIAEDGANEQREDLANGNGDDVGMETERGQGDGEGVGTAGAARAEQPIDVDDDPLIGPTPAAVPILDPDEAWALVAAPDAQLLVDADQLEYLRQAVVDRTEGFTIEELELLSADMCAIVNARRLDWDRRAMIDDLLHLVEEAGDVHEAREAWLATVGRLGGRFEDADN